RQNLNPGDWEANSITAGLTSDADCTAQSMLNPNNKMFGGKAISPADPPGTDPGEFDPETVTDPATDGNNQMSTAYIRNAPMLSPWELGFIHRGQAWQTLNLKNYDREKAITPITSGSIQILPGGGAYSKGDANILDQVKMTIDAKSKDKKINLKAQGKRSKEILSALFHVKTGANLSNSDLVSKVATSSNRDDYLNEVAGGTPVLDADRDSIAKNIQDRSPGLLTRAGIAEEESLRKGATDAEQEEIIGKMINLTELSEDLEFFELIILSQAIKDVGNYNYVTGSIPIKKSYFYNGETRTTGDIDAKVGEINFADADGKHRIADEITAQRKIRVRGYRKSDHSVQLISIKQSE
ncbi:MAG: hypothetical protein PHH65_06410, partial [Eubacteriales bacterium]|nr:hypothetical protein [Eubacteriales bacterium]